MILGLSRSRIISAIGYLIIACGCLNLAGWQFDVVSLKSILPGKTLMNPVTACTFIACGLWMLLFREKGLKTILLVICGIVTFVGLVHLVTYYKPLNIRFDHFLYHDKIAHASIPSLIAPNTALLFFLSGITMCKVASRYRWVLVLRQVFVFTGFSLVYFSLLGYIYNIPPAYQLAGYAPMSLFTALCFMLLYTGLFLSNVELGISRIFFSSLRGSRLLRSALLIMLILPSVTGYLRLLGEKKGLYPPEVGVEINTLAFTYVVLVLIVMYALAENKRQLADTRAKLQLAASELKFRTIFQSLKEGVACLDFNGRCLYCNESYCRIIGYTEKEILGQVVIEKIIPASERPAFYERLAERRKGKEHDYQTSMVRGNGERIWIDIKSRTMTDNDGNAYGYLVSVTDITEERLKLEDLKAFSGSAAHDLNSPLGRIITLAEFLGEDKLSLEERRTFLAGIRETAYSMRQLLQDLLAFSKLGSGQLDKKELNVSDMVRNICKTLTPKDLKVK